jgi:hypothetical protein
VISGVQYVLDGRRLAAEGHLAQSAVADKSKVS